MNRVISSQSNTHRLASCPPVSNCSVKDGLAYTPADMSSMQNHGYSISAQTFNSQFFEGFDTPPDEVPIEQRRGIDVVQAWEASKDAVSNVRRAQKHDIDTYG